MLRKRWVIGGAVILALIAAPIAWWLISPLFITVSVDEEFPVVEAAAPDSAVAQAAPEGQPAVVTTSPTPVSPTPTEVEAPTITPPVESGVALEQAPSATETAAIEPSATATAVIEPTHTVPATAPAAVPPTLEPTPSTTGPVALLSGSFHPVEHEGTGTATIYRLEDGKLVLRFENFEVLNGPDLFVWLSGASDANGAQEILDGGYISLGSLKGNSGNQNYELPGDIDLSKYHSVSIWCRAFSVNFATAPLR